VAHEPCTRHPIRPLCDAIATVGTQIYPKPQIPREPNKQARVRSFLNLGTVKFKMRAVVEIAPTLLHLAVLLFFVGLGMLFVPIHKTVGITISIVVGLWTGVPRAHHTSLYQAQLPISYTDDGPLLVFMGHNPLFRGAFPLLGRTGRAATLRLPGWK
jgi:hypothetical protein